MASSSFALQTSSLAPSSSISSKKSSLSVSSLISSMDLPHQHRYQDQSSTKVFIESCLDTFESIPISNPQQQQQPQHISSSSSTSSSETLVHNQQQQQQDNTLKRAFNNMDHPSSSHHHHHHHHHHSEIESVASSSTAASSTTQNVPAYTSGLPLAYPLIAEALVREGFPDFASALAFTQDQRQLEQAFDYPSQDQHVQQPHHYHHHQQQQQQQPHPQQQLPFNDDGYLFNMLMSQPSYDAPSSASSSSTPYSQVPPMHNNDMTPLELMQYNTMMLDGQILDEIPYNVGCGAEGPGMDGAGYCESPQLFGLGGAHYIGNQYSQPVQQMHQQQYQPGYFDATAMPYSSASSSGSHAASSSSNSSQSYGFSYPAWSQGLLYQQGDYLLEHKRDGASGLPPVRVQPPLERPEGPDSDDEDEDEDDDVESSSPSMPSDHQFNNGFRYSIDDTLPPLSMPGRSTIRRSSKHDRDDDRVASSSSKRPRSESTTSPAAVAAAAAAATVAAQRRVSGANYNSHNHHSRNSSMSSTHSHSSLLDPSCSPSSSSSSNGKAPKHQVDTIEKRMHPCTFEGCTKSFTRAFNLRSHLNTHNGERPHKCQEPGCEWDFVRRHDLDRHIKSKHMANKPYACKQCTSRFGRSDALQRHRRLENHM